VTNIVKLTKIVKNLDKIDRLAPEIYRLSKFPIS